MTKDQSHDPQAGDPEDLVDLGTASKVLGVPVDQVRAMSEQGLITARNDGDDPQFQRAELIAARDLGG